MKKRIKEGLAALVLSASIALTGCYKKIENVKFTEPGFSFIAFSDAQGHYFEFRRLLGFSKTLDTPKADFLVGVGDICQVWRLDEVVSEFYDVWYPVMGNHDYDPKRSNKKFIEENILPYLPGIVNIGPTSEEDGVIYSFDYRNAHFIVLDGYYQGWKGNIHNNRKIDDPTKDQYDWLKNDLEKTDKEFKFVFVHEPAYPQTRRHWGDSLNYFKKDRDAFWELLVKHDVTAFFAGHTHKYAKILKDGVWHVNAGRACCKENSLVYIFVGDDEVTFRVYKAGKKLRDMNLVDGWTVKEKK